VCTAAGADPGVFLLPATAQGAAGSACAGTSFTITLIDATFGQVRLTPQPAGAHVVLPVVGSICEIDFNFDVLRLPSVDQNPVGAGLQTAQVLDFTVNDGGPITASARGTSIATVDLAAPIIDTVASANIAIGGVLTDQATVSGRVNPLAGATVDFRLFGPNDATCTGAPVFESLGVAYPQAGGPVTSAPFTPTIAGTYRWIATYNGDANNSPAIGVCGATNETPIVSAATPTIDTVASAGVVIGGPLTDQATVSGRVNPLAGATVDFRLFGPNDATCAGPPAFESIGVAYPQAGGTVASNPFTPTAVGTYRWIAVYNGDANNSPAIGVCGATNETPIVTTATPAINTIASATVVMGGSLTDQATVTGRVNPLPGGTIDFRLYGPNDATCAGTPVFVSLAVDYPQAGGPVSSTAFTPTTTGTYRWIATYNGDANNAAATDVCNTNTAESVNVSPTPPIPATPVVPVTPAPPDAPLVVDVPSTLPVTGSASAPFLEFAALSTAVGTALVASTRRRRARSSAAEDGHVQPAVGGERFTGPPAPTFAQAKAGEARHQVELTRPRVATDDRIHGDATRRERHVALVECLSNWIVPTNIEPNPVDGERLGVDVLVVAQPVEVARHERLDDEAALRCEMRGDVLETTDLIVLRQQVEQRVEHEIHERILAGHPDIGEVADRHRELVAARLRPQSVDHRLRQVDTVDAHAACCQRQGNPTGTDRQLQRRSATGPRLEKSDGGVFVASQYVVVGGRRGPVEAHHRLVVLHAADPSRIRPSRATELHRNYDRPA
jgi:hypothetical protein